MQSIYDYSKDFKQVKVVLTIRSFFWDDDSFSENMIILDLLPFDSNQMIDFFQKSFYKNNLAIDKAKEIANDFKYTDEENEYVYHPYLLDVVRSMVSVGLNKYPNDPKFKSKILRSEVRNDYIIYKICDREVIRIGQISVDKQIKFFIKMSVEKAGIIKFKDFDAELSKSIKKRLDKKSIKAFKSHPLIDNDKKYFSFKYDFFEDYFKCIYVSEFLRYSSKEACITDKLIHILCESCWFGSGISKDVRNRILEWGEDDILKCSYIVEQIYSSRYEDDMKKMAVSGVFNLALMLNMKFFSNTTTENTKLLKKIFEEKENVISNMQLRNIYDKYDVVKFDFSDTAIQASTIDNYKSFWHCRFNEMTLFQDSLLINNKANIEHDLKITKDQFIDCTTDKDFDNVFEIQKEKDKSYATEIECFIQRYLRLFYNKGRLVGQTVDKPSYGKSAYNCLRISYGKQSNNIMSFKEAMDFFKRQEIIEFYEEYNEQKASIKKIYNEDIVRYIEEGTMSPVIMRIYDELINCK